MMSSWKSTNDGSAVVVPLQQWAEDESRTERQKLGCGEAEKKQMLLRKTVVAYGIAELLRQARSNHYPASCDGDNFLVRTKAPSRRSHPTWKDIEGVDMLLPRLSMNIVEPSFLQEEIDNGDHQDDEMGGYLEAEFPSLRNADGAPVFVDQSQEDDRCHKFGLLLYELFFECSLLSAGDNPNDDGGSKSASRNFDASLLKRARKKIKTGEGCSNMSDNGLPASLCMVIQNLLDSGKVDRPDDAYDSLDGVIKDLHLLLLDPSRFLFNQEPLYDKNGRKKLLFREHQLYGRENEVTSITDAFCRVSGGKSEAFFLGGFSGSGKSRLVNGLTARINISGGYVLTHKFDQMLEGRSMLEVISLFNELCKLVLEKNSQENLRVIANDIVRVFGSDLALLAQLLPDIKMLLPPHLNRSADKRDNQINLQSICFTLQRFVRVLSSAAHPVVLFFDDLQWCDKWILAVLESLLCDVHSTFLFFVGTYRSNEVADDDEIFCLTRRLKSFGVSTTILSLDELNPSDLNTMISDALCIFPRIAEPLSSIIYQKTKGNPLFVLAFMRSLVDKGLLEYNTNTMRWVWDEDDVSSMDITDNVIYLLSSKMSGLSPNIQAGLKIAACFGTKIKQSVVAILGTDSVYSDIHNKLAQVVKEGFMVKVGITDFKFVHDKVREAAYSLIPEVDKNQYHYNLGMALYSTSKGIMTDDLLFSIADQIMHDIDNPIGDNPELRIDIAKLYMLAGTKAADRSDFAASRSYSTYALSILPSDHWISHYDLSLRCSFRSAKSCYSCGDKEKAQCMLEELIGHCHSIEDKVPALSLVAKILLDRKSYMEAYALSQAVLSQLGEEIPNAQDMDPNRMKKMVEVTLKLVGTISDRNLLNMKDMDERLSITMHFYNIMGTVAYFGKHEMIHFIACRMVGLTMKHGLCKHSILGLLQFASVLCNNMMAKKGIESASRIGKAAVSCFKERYNTPDLVPDLHAIYYGLLAPYTEPLQMCADMLRQGFDAGMSLGETGAAFINSSLHIRTALIAGDRLPTLLEKVDCYLKQLIVNQNEASRHYLLIFRGTISVLIGKEDTTSPPRSDAFGAPTDTENSNMLESMYFHLAIQAYWLGHSERCQYFIEEFQRHTTSDISDMCRLQFITFIQGINSFRLMRAKRIAKTETVTKKAIKMLNTAASLCDWNFRNKTHLLEAEQFSHENKNSQAHASYVAAINSARSSGFIHEQGLACELAGYHYKNVCDFSSAWNFFDQAKQCYSEWGSLMKVESVTHQLDSLSDYRSVGQKS